MTIQVLTPEQMTNRRNFVKALIEEKGAQCRADLFDSVLGDDGETKEARCALGVAVTLFFGIKNREELEAFEADGREVYGVLQEKLGLYHQDDTSALSFIWTLNDLSKMSFAEIGDTLSREWRTDK